MNHFDITSDVFRSILCLHCERADWDSIGTYFRRLVGWRRGGGILQVLFVVGGFDLFSSQYLQQWNQWLLYSWNAYCDFVPTPVLLSMFFAETLVNVVPWFCQCAFWII